MPDIRTRKTRKTKKIHFPVPSDLQQVLYQLQSHGHRVVIIGGAPRDFLLSGQISDYDLASDALPEQVQALFRRCLPTGIRYGTVTIMRGAESYEITTFRSDGAYKDGRRPERVNFSNSLLCDLERRDFSINAIAFEPDPLSPPKGPYKAKIPGMLHDLHNGQEDLKQQQICAIGVARQRFEEDALRMLRACRLSAKLGFSIEAQTLEAIRELHANLTKVSKERILAELSKLLTAPHAALGLRYLGKCALWSEVFALPEPTNRNEMENLFCLWQKHYALLQAQQRDLPESLLPALSALSALPSLPFLSELLRCVENNQSAFLRWNEQKVTQLSFAWALLHLGSLPHNDEPSTQENEELQQSLRAAIFEKARNGEWTGWQLASQGSEKLLFSKRDRNAALYLLRWKNLVWGCDFLYAYSQQPELWLRHWLAIYGPDFSLPALCLMALSLEAQRSQEIERLWSSMMQDLVEVLAQKPPLCLQELAINGRILAQDCAIPPGPHTAVILQELLARVLREPQQNRLELLQEAAKELYKNIVDARNSAVDGSH